MFGAFLKATNSSFKKGMTFGRSIYVKKVMKLLSFIFEQPSYIPVRMHEMTFINSCARYNNPLSRNINSFARYNIPCARNDNSFERYNIPCARNNKLSALFNNSCKRNKNPCARYNKPYARDNNPFSRYNYLRAQLNNPRQLSGVFFCYNNQRAKWPCIPHLSLSSCICICWKLTKPSVDIRGLVKNN